MTRFRPQSLRKRLLLYLFLSAIIVFLLTELIFLEKNRRSLVKMLDRTAEACALNLAAILRDEANSGIGSDSFDEIMRGFGSHSTRVYFLIFRLSDNQEIERSESLKDVNVPIPQPLREFQRGETYFWNARINGERVRFVALRQAAEMHVENDETGIVVSDEEESQTSRDGAAPSDDNKNEFVFIVGLSERYLWKQLENTFEVIGPVLGIGLVLMLLLSWIVIDRGLKPLRHLESEVNSLSSSNMTPVTTPEDRELASIANALNIMIENLSEAFERERRFTANVAHELRTRISEMRSLSEVALRLEENSDKHNRRNYEEMLASAKEMQKIVTNLLTLARCHSGQLKPRNDRVKLNPLISTIWNEYSDRASTRGITAYSDIPSDLVIVTDKDLFETLLQNLFSNAVSYATEHGKIEWKSAIQNDEFSFSISNSVRDLSENDLLLMFEPFWQKEGARTTGNEHSGFGLSLVRSLAEVLGLTINTHLTPPCFLTITLSQKIR